jgi:hypothetical protein
MNLRRGHIAATRVVATATLRLARIDIYRFAPVIAPASVDDAGVGAGTATAVGEATATGLVCAATERAGAGPAFSASAVACAPDDAEGINFG